jgi:trk system potassium uptake protein
MGPTEASGCRDRRAACPRTIGGPVQSGGVHRRGSRLGDVRVRRGRRQSEVIDVKRIGGPRPRRPFVVLLIVGFAALILVGTALLMLPGAAIDGQSVGFTAALFTATSAVCVTGLVLFDTRDGWSPFGQAVILALIQIGGLGFMTGATLLLLVLGRRISVRQQLAAGEMAGRLGTEPIPVLVRRIVAVTLAIEAAGIVAMVAAFSLADRAFGGEQLWRGVFTSISAFNNAGFDLEGGRRSLTEYAGNPLVLLSVMVLAFAGATGYAVWQDIVRQRRWARLHLNTKIVLATTGMLTLVSIAVLLIDEAFTAGTMHHLVLSDAATVAVAESVYARTSGFTAIDLGRAEHGTAIVIMAMMFIGGASASTAGGIKLNTFSVLFYAIVASIRGNNHVHAFGREIPWRQVNRALAVALLAVAFVVGMTYLLSLTVTAPFEVVLFEVISAFATCGLSLGLTGDLEEWSRLLLVFTMFVGRLGPLTFGLALAAQFDRPDRIRYAEADVNIG